MKKYKRKIMAHIDHVYDEHSSKTDAILEKELVYYDREIKAQPSLVLALSMVTLSIAFLSLFLRNYEETLFVKIYLGIVGIGVVIVFLVMLKAFKLLNEANLNKNIIENIINYRKRAKEIPKK